MAAAISQVPVLSPRIDIDGLIARQPRGRPLEQAFYADPDIFARDMDRLVGRLWLQVDHVSRIPEPGDYFLFRVGGEEMIVIRDKAGEIHALFNVCRHRGSRICLATEGNRRLLACPYHAWTYDLDGRLKAARHMPADFDPDDHALHRAHVHIFEGLIFINLTDGAAPDFNAAYDIMRPYLVPQGLTRAKIAAKESYPTRANWKLVVENFFECYHCLSAHPEFCTAHTKAEIDGFGAGEYSGPKQAMDDFASLLAEWEKRAAAMGHATGCFNDDEHSDFYRAAGRIPLKRGHLSETRDGKPVAPLMGDLRQHDGGYTYVTFHPLVTLLMSNDHAVVFRFTPIEPLLTDVELTWLVRDDALEGRDYDRDALTWFWDVTTRQDAKITEDNQAGVLSSRYRPGRYSEIEEGIDRIARWYLRRIS
ncbi:MAG: aromatic ring-hydroxylating dioxygenase subunit alpha [Dongiaceae bacterium]